jgi:hypothetical protein
MASTRDSPGTRPLPVARFAAVILGLLACVGPAVARVTLDGREDLDRRRPEAWALRWFAAAVEPSGFGVPELPGAGRVELSLELDAVPRLSAKQRTVGFGGTKTEDLNRSPVLAYPRVRVGLPAGFVLDGSWAPPVALDGARANLFGIGLSRTVLERGGTRLGLRLGVFGGTIRGDFTCPSAAAAAGDDPARNPYACESASDDSVRIGAAGLEATLAHRFRRRPALESWLAVSARRLDSSFRADARWNGIDDRSRLDYRGSDWGLGAGLSWRRGATWRYSAEARWVPLEVARPPAAGGRQRDDLLQARVRISLRFR